MMSPTSKFIRSRTSIVNLGDANIDVRDLMNLDVGDIIQLGTDATLPLDILVEGVPKFKGIPGLLKGNRAIRVTESMIE